MRRAHGFHLRRRAHDVSADRRIGRPASCARNKNIYLCTNGMFIVKRLHEFKPDKRFFFNVHLDGLEKTHDICVEREGVFREAIEGIKAAKAAGFMVCTNTTIYKETDMKEIEALFEYLEQFNLDGHQLAPAYGYSAVNDREIFMTRDDIREKFKDIDRLARAILHQADAAVSGLSEGRARAALHRLGHADLQHQRLERPVLSDHRRPLQDLRGVDDPDPLGKLRPGQRSAL